MNNLKNNLKPGTLIQLSSKTKETLLKERDLPRFCSVDIVNGKIRADLGWEDRVPTTPGNLLLFIEPLDYSKDTSAWPATTRTAAAASAATVMSWTDPSMSSTLWEKAREEFKTTGRIPGGIFLTPNGQLVWISHYDLEHFDKI